MIRRGRSSETKSEKSQFVMTKALVLAATEFKQRSGINSAASFAMDGHSVDLSEELLEQKPSIVRSTVWDTANAPEHPKNQSTGGIIRVCWQCPETSTAFDNRDPLANKLMA